MSSTAKVFDASAALAILFEEQGCQPAREMLAGSSISAVNAAEVVHKLVHKGLPRDAALEAFEALDLTIVPFGQKEYRLTLNYVHPGLSLGDRACLATAEVHKAEAVTADRSWSRLRSGVRVAVIR